jgi:hypothetical protein
MSDPSAEPGAAARAEVRRRSPILLATLAVLVSLLASLTLLELALRIGRGSLLARPDFAGGLHMLRSGYPGSYHARLGFVPTPGPAPENVWGTRVSVREDGLRSNGGPPPGGVPILAVGDSFTWGDEVDDDQTWPSLLERRLGRPVLNGGVFGYGFDQIVLRAEALLERFPAVDTLVVSLIPDDVLRCEYAYRYAWKPYFELAQGALVLRNVPVPPPHHGPRGESAWRRSLRWSFLVDLIMRRLDPQGWLLPDSLRVHRQGVAVARRLVDRLADHARRRGHRLLLMLQWHPLWDGDPAAPVLARARERGVELLRVEPPLRAAMGRERGSARRFFFIEETPQGELRVKHMNPAGNALVAQLLAELLVSQ